MQPYIPTPYGLNNLLFPVLLSSPPPLILFSQYPYTPSPFYFLPILYPLISLISLYIAEPLPQHPLLPYTTILPPRISPSLSPLSTLLLVTSLSFIPPCASVPSPLSPLPNRPLIFIYPSTNLSRFSNFSPYLD